MQTAALDLVSLGARAVPSRELLRLVLRRADDDALDRAVRALALVGAARDAALLDLPEGPRLAAALELGRRAWMLPSPGGRRVASPVDVAAAVAPRVGGATDAEAWVLALDARMCLARLQPCASEAGRLLRAGLLGGGERLLVAVRHHRPAVPSADDRMQAVELSRLAAACGAPLLDWVILGEDGFCSLLRLGLLPSVDRRYS
ncbi:MAG: hypothetical protein IT382_20890 [Deltaproteobacteria bacterium]|nr:hypothetical protein [Deltaproteobacteria bacterium]